jgi:hypothetical protein
MDAVFIFGKTVTIHDCSNWRTDESDHSASASGDLDNQDAGGQEQDVA